MMTCRFWAGRKEKIRPGDVLGALTSDEGGPAYTREQIGKIQVTEFCTFVAVAREVGPAGLRQAQRRQGQRQECESPSYVALQELEGVSGKHLHALQPIADYSSARRQLKFSQAPKVPEALNLPENRHDNHRP
jgi:hypothetical protein